MRLHDETVFWSPSIDVYRLEDRWVIYAELPGVARDQLEVVVGPTYVHISGKKGLPMRGVSPRSLEIDTGRFSREIEIQGRLDPSRSRAVLSDGLLRLEIMALDSRRVPIPITDQGGDSELESSCRVESDTEFEAAERTRSEDTDD